MKQKPFKEKFQTNKTNIERTFSICYSQVDIDVNKVDRKLEVFFTFVWNVSAIKCY